MELGLRIRPGCVPSTSHRDCARHGCGLRVRSIRAQASRDESLQEMQRYSKQLGSNLSGLEDRLKADRSKQASADQRWRTAAAATGSSSSLKELNKDNFHSFLEEAADTLVVVDFYTDWCGPCKLMLPHLEQMPQELSECGPCKVMLPHLEQMSQELGDSVKLVKFNCSKENKDLGKSLGIRVAPTFHLYRKSEKVAEMNGAKVDALRDLISKHK